MSSAKPLLSIITPFYTRIEEGYLLDRTLWFIETNFSAPWLERVLVDYGSPSHIARRVQAHCTRYGWRYLNLDKGRTPFSAGYCRNRGVQVASAEFVSFQDVDLIAPSSLYERIRLKLLTNDLPINHLELIPCFYLTEAASASYLEQGIEDAHSAAYQAYLEGDTSTIQAVAPVTSSIIVRRDFCLAEGGNRSEFFGHGYEDFEFMNRLAQRSRRFHRSHDFYGHSHKADGLEYKGYRAFFSMFGRENLAEKVFFVHLHHEVPADPGYKTSSARNRKLFESFLRNYDQRRDSPPAMEDLNAKEATLCIGSRTSIPYKSIRFAIPHLGRIAYRHESDFRSEREFIDWVAEMKFSRVLFMTPYGNQERKGLYDVCRRMDIPYMVFDRGALPDSWFFDPKGFNADSGSYDPCLWDKPLSPEQTAETEVYIQNLCSTDTTLETNGQRKGAYELKRSLNLLDKKILFVPLQRPNDSVIKFFSGNLGGIEGFKSIVKAAAELLPPDWKIVIKQHPLEHDEPSIAGVITAASDTHVYDLIEAADSIAVINSGVGLLGLCFGKPVYCFGESFYTQPGLATQIRSAKALQQAILANQEPDPDAILRFVNYLKEEFYSFARTEYIEENNGGQSRSVAIDHEFSVLRLPGKTIKLQFRQDFMSTRAPAYDFFRGYFSRQASSSDQFQSTVKADKPPSVIAKTAGKSVQVVTDRQGDSLAMPGTPTRAGMNVINIPNGSQLARKARKLLREPRLFVKDAIRNHM